MLDKTERLLDNLCDDELFVNHDIRFVGGTALSYYLKHRLSEDLDFTMLKFDFDVINEMMLKYGAVQIDNSSSDDTLINDGFYSSDCYATYKLNNVKIDFFEAPLNIMENEVWTKDEVVYYKKSKLRILSLQSVLYMKTLAFWSRKKYRDIFDIYYALRYNHISSKEFLETYLKYHITYTLDDLYKKISSKDEFYEKQGDEGLYKLVDESHSYEWYRNEIEKFIYQEVLKGIYK